MPTPERPDNAAPWRDPELMRGLLGRIHDDARRLKRPVAIMEVCGGQTWTLSRYRLEELLPENITMVHGPGCPVCVTPPSTIDSAITLARQGVIVCSFGDMMRVPGSRGDSLLRAKADGADVRLLYSPLEALSIALDKPDKEVIFLAIGFETTMPVYALLLKKARAQGVENLSILTSLFTVPGVIRDLKADPDTRLDALLAAGHVCAVTGLEPYEALASELKLPIVVGGFEPVDMLLAISRAVAMLADERTGVDNAYARVVTPGSHHGWEMVMEVFESAPVMWRGLGTHSGMTLRREYAAFDARRRFALEDATDPASECIAPMIMKGLKLPADCPCFGTRCTPTAPVGAPMVSSEGVCAAHFRYR